MNNDAQSKHVNGFAGMRLRDPKNWQPLQLAVSRLLHHHPFWATLLLDKMTIKLTEDIPTLATDGKTCAINPAFFEGLTRDLRVSAICHEIGHNMLLHLQRSKRYRDLGFDGGEFHPMLWNVAGDLFINSLLKDSGLPIDKGWLLDENNYPHTFGSVDEIYRDLLKKHPPPPRGKKPKGKPCYDGDGGEPGEGDGGEPDDVEVEGDGWSSHHQLPDMEPHDTHIIPDDVHPEDENEWKQAVIGAAAVAKSMGKMPAGVARYVQEFTDPKINWKEQLRRLVARCTGSEALTWTRPHRRRLVATKVWFPRRTGHSAGTVVIGVDTSGSISRDEMSAFLGETSDILTNCNPRMVFLAWCDAGIGRVDELYNASDLATAVEAGCPGGGGTSFVPVFDWVNENQVAPDTLIYFTDTYGSFPSAPPHYPVIWVRTTNGDVPWGDTVDLDVSS